MCAGLAKAKADGPTFEVRFLMEFGRSPHIDLAGLGPMKELLLSGDMAPKKPLRTKVRLQCMNNGAAGTEDIAFTSSYVLSNPTNYEAAVALEGIFGERFRKFKSPMLCGNYGDDGGGKGYHERIVWA